jgi:acylphosphatase
VICKHVYYSGRVQGVGFRYTVRQLAEDFPVTGFVRNLPGGQVEVVTEGDTDQVEAFLQAIDNRMKGYIVESRVHDEDPQGIRTFEIRY